jgi:hypothetical protein
MFDTLGAQLGPASGWLLGLQGWVEGRNLEG